jgi:hypothetical protein
MFGILATAHVMLFGDYMAIRKVNGVYRMNSSFKRFVVLFYKMLYFIRFVHCSAWNLDLWKEFTDKLLNIRSCEELPDLTYLIRQFSDHLQSLLIEEREQWADDLNMLREAMK